MLHIDAWPFDYMYVHSYNSTLAVSYIPIRTYEEVGWEPFIREFNRASVDL